MTEKQKKSIFKRWWFWAIIVLVFLYAIGSGGDEDAQKEVVGDGESSQIEDNVAPEGSEPEEKEEKEKETEEPKKSVKDDVPREYKNALKSAQNYIDVMSFSEQGLFEQLTSEYGDQYPKEAAQYAIENVEVDYNEEALEAAKNYQETMSMSNKELFDQLTSEHGDKFTEEQAQYAIDNLPE